MRYAVVIEKADGNYSAHVLDLPGCVATGATVEAVKVTVLQLSEAEVAAMAAASARACVG